MSIRKKIPFLLITLICVPLFFLAGIIYYYSSNVFIQKSKNNIYQVAQTEGKAFQAVLNERKYEIRLLAKDSKVVKAVTLKGTLDHEDFYNSHTYEDLKALFIEEGNILEEEGISKTFIADTEGNIIVSSDITDLGYSIKEREYYKKALNGETVFSDAMFSKAKDRTFIVVATPVKNNSNGTIAVICKTFINKSFSNFVDKIEIGETGYAYLVDRDGYLISHPNKAKEGLLVENHKIRSVIRNIRDGKVVGGNVDTYVYEGQKKYVSFYIIPSLNWILCVAQNIEEINREAYTEFLIVISINFILIVIISLISLRISNMICAPIDELMETMNNVAHGNLESYCTYAKVDEFGQLSQNYNSMIKTLARSQEDLRISEEKYRLTLEALEEVIWEYDLEKRQFAASSKLKELTGYSSEEIGVKEFVDTVIMNDCSRGLRETLSNCLRGRQEVFEEELLLHIDSEKERKWILCRGRIVRKNNKPYKFIGVMSDITTRKENEEKVRKLVYFDTLTGLLNKQTFTDILKEWIPSETVTCNAALFFIDLDHFKNLNDTLGHDMGDQLLTAVARKVKQAVPSDTLICRFGGDEFVIFKNGFKIVEEIQELAYSILNIFKEKIVINDMRIHTSCSMGIALYPLDGRTAEILLKNADTAMYKAKSSGRSRYRFYDENMSKSLDRRLLVEHALREAIEKKYLFIQYQPIMDLDTGKVIAAEALLRLDSEATCFVSPIEFIPIAEETGLIVPIGEWVIETALRELKKCRQMGCEDLSMAINVSSIQIKQEDFVCKLERLIEKLDIPPQLVKLEITESVLIENLETNINIFNELKKLGLQIALDDFGTGYSSLNYLCNIPFDILKIDKSFIDEIGQKEPLSDIVDSIINMAHTLDIQVIAEGIETVEQLEIMREKKCDMVQGYVFSKPLPQEEFEIFLEINSTRLKDTSVV